MIAGLSPVAGDALVKLGSKDYGLLQVSGGALNISDLMGLMLDTLKNLNEFTDGGVLSPDDRTATHEIETTAMHSLFDECDTVDYFHSHVEAHVGEDDAHAAELKNSSQKLAYEQWPASTRNLAPETNACIYARFGSR